MCLFSTSMTTLLTSRFLLDLQAENRRSTGWYPNTSQSFSFASNFSSEFIGALGSRIGMEEAESATMSSFGLMTIPAVVSYSVEPPAYYT